jgi:hypothetical protein
LRQELLPDGLGRGRCDAVHVIPEALGSQVPRRSLGPPAQQTGASQPIPHGVLADGVVSAVDGGQAEVVARAESLRALSPENS